MLTHDQIKQILARSGWDKNRGFNLDAFEKAFEQTKASHDEITHLYHQYTGYFKNGMPVNPLPQSPNSWKRPPKDENEEAVYHGVHLHTESNPFGLHSHLIGGKLGGAHTHGPENRFGAHHHRADGIPEDQMIDIDGSHEHKGVNYPDGEHDHQGENFG